jgi:NADH-quinone oxidoreductase subunit F
LYQSPTVINNVETLSNLPDIVLKGAEWYAGIGTEKSSGTKLFPVSGHVEKPGLYELPMGTSLREIIYDHCGGVKGGKKLKAVIPGGSSTPMLRAEDIDVNMDFESLAEAGTMLGAGSVIVMDETTCIVWVALRLSKFYAHESCGQCTPCREGVPWMVKILQRIEDGEGKQEDIDLLLDICDNIFGMCLCPLGDAAVGPVQSSIQKFREEYEAHVREGRCVVKT